MTEKSNILSALPSVDWRTVCQNAGLPLVVYGMGNGADKLEARLSEVGLSVSDYIASDDFVRGQSFRGHRVLTYREAVLKHGDFILLVAFGTRLPEVLSHIESLGRERTLLIPDMPIAGDDYFDVSYANAHGEELLEAYETLFDDLSRETFLSLASAKISGDYHELMAKVQTKDDIFEEMPLANVKTVADFGAYNGDTVREIFGRAGNLSLAIAVEPDKRTFKKLSVYADLETRFSVVPIHAAVGGTGRAVMHASGNRNSSLYNASFEKSDDEVPLLSVDEILRDYDVDYLKMDVEGAELYALRSATQTLRRCRPILKIAAYHRSEDIFSLLLFLKAHTENYRFLLRRTPCIPAWEADIIAIPNEVTT